MCAVFRERKKKRFRIVITIPFPYMLDTKCLIKSDKSSLSGVY